MSDNDKNVDMMAISGVNRTYPAMPQCSGMKKNNIRSDKEHLGSSDEQQWLKAIENSKMNEVDVELKNITLKDPKMMTARQRAILGKTCDKEFTEKLVALPSGYKEKRVTPETLEKNAIRLEKRREQAKEKKENDKKRIIEKLLNKRESKFKKNFKGRKTEKDDSKIVYTSRDDKITLQFPDDVDFPLKRSVAKPPPKQKMCGMDGCQNPKKYSCSQTGMPLCSLECYKANQLKIGNTAT